MLYFMEAVNLNSNELRKTEGKEIIERIALRWTKLDHVKKKKK